MQAEESVYTEIGAFDAKTKLSEILRKVDQGERFTITVRGRAVADVVPSQLKDRRRAAEAVRRLLAMPRIEGIAPETVREWIEEGRH
ncbi:MAG: type II toxin-antitoxin system prevent-host-death family antitoxin [Terracidiphilus sp.]|jgi:prevent-host-death family protein